MSSQSPGKWVGIVGAITLLFGIWIGGASTSRVYCAWYFAVNIDDYIAADFVVDQVEHHGAGKQYEDVWTAHGRVGNSEEEYDLKQEMFRLPSEKDELLALFPQGMIIPIWYNSSAARETILGASRRAMSTRIYGDKPWWKVMWMTISAYSPLVIGAIMLRYYCLKTRNLE